MSKRFLGSGWPFPVDLDGDGIVPYISQEKKIEESAVIILGTARGERVMRPDFGSRLQELVFAPMNASTKSLVARYATDALVTWEPRIEVLSVTSEEAPGARGKLLVNVEYRVRSTNSIFNLVYPFYLKGGKS